MSKDLIPGPGPAGTTAPTAASSAAAPAPTVTTTTDDRSQSFKPVTGGPELASGEKLLVEAYAAIWIILFALVLLSWRRQRGIEARVAHLEDAIQKARAAAEKEGD